MRSSAVEILPETRTRRRTLLLPLCLVACGIVPRLILAHETFLNPDEALHYLLSDQSSLATAYKASLTTAEPLFVTDLCAGDWRLRAGAISRGARTGRAAWHLDRRPTGRGDAMRVSDLYSRLEGEKARTPARHRRYLATVLDFS